MDQAQYFILLGWVVLVASEVDKSKVTSWIDKLLAFMLFIIAILIMVTK